MKSVLIGGRAHLRARDFALFSPWALLAGFVLLLNDHWLKASYGNVLTGKLSDVAAAFLLPAWLEYIFAWRLAPLQAIRLASLLSCGILIGLELWPAFSACYIAAHNALFQTFGFELRSQLTADPSDLLALLVLPFYMRYASRLAKNSQSS